MSKMKNGVASKSIALATILLCGCSCDVHDERLIGPYRLSAIDVHEQMSIYYDLGDGSSIGRISETVFAVGWNEKYIVAKQHPNNDRRVTNYYYLEIARDSKYADPSASVTGPLSESEFKAKQVELGLPSFTRSIKSLE